MHARRLAPPAVLAMAAALVPAATLAAQDVPTVHMTGPGAWENPRLVEELRIGSLDGADEYLFGSVRYVAAGLDGSVFVADGQGPRVRLYSPEGEYVRNVGRLGQGPGEYEGIYGMGITPDGELAVFDLGRISLFDAGGDFLRSFPFNNGGVWLDDAFRTANEGGFLVYTVRISGVTLPDGRTLVTDEGALPRFYMRVSPTGELLDSLIPPEPRAPPRPSFVIMTDQGNLQPFVDRLVLAVSPRGYLVSGYPTEYAIHRLDRDGRPVATFRRDFDPLPLEGEERDQWKARADYYSARGRGASSGVELPDTKPAFRDLYVDEDGRIWVHRYVEAVDHAPDPDRDPDLPRELTWREPATFDVFEPTGRFLGTVVLPPRTTLRFIRGDHLWGVHRGEFDEPYVVRFRLETGG